MPTKRAKEIALAFPRGAHQEVFINGVLRYAGDHGCNWSYITAPESLALSVLDLQRLAGRRHHRGLEHARRGGVRQGVAAADRQHLGHAGQDAGAARERRQPARGRAWRPSI